MTTTFSQLYQKFNQLRGRRIFIIPTRFGFVYAGFLILILLGAINYSNSMGHVLCFLLGSMGIIAMLHTYRNLAKIELTQVQVEPVFLGQIIHFNLLLDNPSKYNNYQIEITSKQDKTRSWNPFKKLVGYQHHQTVSLLKAQQITRIHHLLPSQHRGKQALGLVRIASKFPLGLFNTWTYFNTDCAALIYPRPQGNLSLPEPQGLGKQLHRHQQHKGVDDFSGFNDYRTGDPIHAIAWKAMARDNVMRIKNFTSPTGGQLILSWDDISQLNTTELRLSQLCQWVLKAESAGLSYGLSLPNSTIEYGHGEQHCHRCLTVLALYEQ